MRIAAATFPLSRYRYPSGNLNTTAVAIEFEGVTGYGFASIGRYAQTGLIEERFAPRLLAAANPDPLEAWQILMRDEKPGGHGERCVAVGALDMALWDLAAKREHKPLWRLLQERFGTPASSSTVPVYAGGGYPYPERDLEQLTEEIRRMLDLGYTSVKIKIGAAPLADDLRRIEAALALVPAHRLAVDAMNRYTLPQALEAARAFAPLGLRWFEDPLDPLDFAAHRELASVYPHPLALGEATFSRADARNLRLYAGLRPDRDVLVFDPAHCYGIPEYLRILEEFTGAGWPRTAFQPHGGHLFSLHVAAGLGLGGSEASVDIFQPFGGFGDDAAIRNGHIEVEDAAPGIGFETRAALHRLFLNLLPVPGPCAP